MSTNTRKIPEMTGKQPLKEGELKCYDVAKKDTWDLSVWNWGANA